MIERTQRGTQVGGMFGVTPWVGTESVYRKEGSDPECVSPVFVYTADDPTQLAPGWVEDKVPTVGLSIGHLSGEEHETDSVRWTIAEWRDLAAQIDRMIGESDG